MIERCSLNNLLGHLEVHSQAMKKVAWLSWLGSALPISNWPWLVSPPATPKTPGQSAAVVTSNRHAKPLGGPKNAYTESSMSPTSMQSHSTPRRILHSGPNAWLVPSCSSARSPACSLRVISSRNPAPMSLPSIWGSWWRLFGIWQGWWW